MSYDILVFDPSHVPSGRKAFLDWWDAQGDWSSEPHPHDDPGFTTPRLRAWFMEMIERHPPLNGPYAVSRHRRAADYCIGRFLIYIAISIDKQATHERAFELAGKHGLGLYEPSSPKGEIWLPGTGATLVLASTRAPREPQPVTDPRVVALAAAHPTGGAIVWAAAFAESPRRAVNVVYSVRSRIEAIASPFGSGAQRTLAELERSLAAAGIAYAVVEQHEQPDFARQLEDALSTAGNE